MRHSVLNNTHGEIRKALKFIKSITAVSMTTTTHVDFASTKKKPICDERAIGKFATAAERRS